MFDSCYGRLGDLGLVQVVVADTRRIPFNTRSFLFFIIFLASLQSDLFDSIHLTTARAKIYDARGIGNLDKIPVVPYIDHGYRPLNRSIVGIMGQARTMTSLNSPLFIILASLSSVLITMTNLRNIRNLPSISPLPSDTSISLD